MAKLEFLPDAEVRAACTGLVDFALWKGVPYARRWPRYKPRDATAAESANQLVFLAGAQLPGLVGSAVREAYIATPPGVNRTWVDLLRAVVMRGASYSLGEPS